MRRVIGFAFGLASMLAGEGAAQAQDATRFDGNWSVVLTCPDASDGARGFTFNFGATVSGGKLHAQFGNLGMTPSLTLDGPIQPDGNAVFDAQGLSGATGYNVGGAERGTPYRRPVTARFENSRGTGEWYAKRVCKFAFTRN